MPGFAEFFFGDKAGELYKAWLADEAPPVADVSSTTTAQAIAGLVLDVKFPMCSDSSVCSSDVSPTTTAKSIAGLVMDVNFSLYSGSSECLTDVSEMDRQGPWRQSMA